MDSNVGLKSRYRFIPLSRWIHEPDWRMEVSHDLPFKDGVSGWLDIEIEAKTPILIGGERRKLGGNKGPTDVDFYKLPDRRFAIPGSTLRGAVRSTLEIAAFGRGAFIDNVRHGLRDLNANEIYQQRLVERVGQGPAVGWPEPLPLSRPKSRGGWLRRTTDTTGKEAWLLRPCSFARVAVTELEKIQRGIEPLLRARENAAERYAHWKSPLECKLAVGPSKFIARSYQQDRRNNQYRPFVGIEYAEARMPKADELGKNGVLVFTGKPARGNHTLGQEPQAYYGKKKHEFFFYDDSADEIDVTHLRSDFEFIHEERPGYPAAASWEFWRRSFLNGSKVPVFFLAPELPHDRIPAKSSDIQALGLAMMFRLPHAATTHDLLRNTCSTHTNENVLDLPTLLFGRAVDRDDSSAASQQQIQGIRGRVTFGPAVIDREAGASYPLPQELAPTLLGSPKAQFYPAYVRQPRTATHSVPDRTYASYTPIARANQATVRFPELSGRKLYPATNKVSLGPAGDSEAMRLHLHPLPANPEAPFKGRVRFRNLKPQELGALVWALRLWAPCWGERPDLRHKIGMAKPFGLGEVDIRLVGARIENNLPKPDRSRNLMVNGAGQVAVAAAEAFADQFVAHMREAYKKNGGRDSWEQSEPIELLLAMSDPEFSRSEQTRNHLDYMVLEDFRRKKRDGATLPEYPRRSATNTGKSPGTVGADQAFDPEHPERYSDNHQNARQRSGRPGAGPPSARAQNPPRLAPKIDQRYYDKKQEQFVRITRIVPERPSEAQAIPANGGQPYWISISDLDEE
jgi:CRISPR-associated protein (TIGR03986 family)